MIVERRHQIGILALSAIADDPRVRRQGDAFHAAGWKVVAFGLLDRGRSPAPPWSIVCPDLASAQPLTHSDKDRNESSCVPNVASAGPDDPRGNRLRPMLRCILPLWMRDVIRPYSNWPLLRAEGRNAIQRCVAALPVHPRRILRRSLGAAFRARLLSINSAYHIFRRARYVSSLLLIRLFPHRAESMFWTLNGIFSDIYRVASQYRPAIWLANDWTTLPLAQRLAREQGVPFGYDTHELATSEYGHQPKWRLLYKPLILALEGNGVARASVVSCVSGGIADHLQRLYRMADRPMVIRNMPNYELPAFRPTRAVRVLYHGIVAPGRGLEACISSVALWAEGRSLSIRGPVQDAYRAELEALIAQTGVGDRVVLLPPVPMVDLVREATAFDIGIFMFPSANQHNTYVLPNKIFEYVMAGLALCVSALPEMAELVRAHDLGVLVEGMEPRMIAAAINSIDPAQVDRFKRNSIKAATNLNWAVESRQLIAAYDRALR